MLALWPQLAMLVLLLTGIGKAATRYGELKKPDHYDMTDVLIGPAVLMAILYFGGFFDPLLSKLAN
jgi:hypothetical protein